jgi:hypothetical protein
MAEKPFKTEGGVKYPASDYACVPDRSKPSTWQLRLSQGKPGNITTAQLGRAAAALGKGFRGNKVDLKCSRGAVKRRIRSEYKKLGTKPEDMPDAVKNMEQIPKSVTVFKNAETGQWLWFGAVSNNLLDEDWPKNEIISSQAHQNFVAAIKSGSFKDKTGLDMPEHWIWHVPVPIGVADVVSYVTRDKQGFLIAAGHGYEGEFYDAVYTGLSKAEDMAMSHTMPGEFLVYNKEQDHIIDDYLSIEFTSLPTWAAANKRTVSAHGVSKDGLGMRFEIDGEMRDWFLNNLGEAVVQEFDDRLSAMADEAERDGVPSKETGMNEEQVLEQEVPEGAPVEEAEATEELEEKADQFPSGDDEDEEEEEEKQEGEEEEEEEEEKQVYVTQEELVKQVIPEIEKGVGELIDQLSNKYDAQFAELKEKVEKTNTISEEQVKEVVEKTPFAGISALFTESVVGQEKARVDYNKDRKLHQDSPEETEDTAKTITGIPGLDEQILGSRKSKRVVSGPMFLNGQQQ